MKHQSHSATSLAASLAVEPKAGTLRAKVYSFIHAQKRSGATDEEICDALRMGGSTERPRRVELVESGHVMDSGKCRYTRSGRLAVVWIAKRIMEAV